MDTAIIVANAQADTAAVKTKAWELYDENECTEAIIATDKPTDACNDLRTVLDMGYTTKFGTEVDKLYVEYCNKMWQLCGNYYMIPSKNWARIC